MSEQKAEEAKLIKARQEGFQAALALLGETSAGNNYRERTESLPLIPAAAMIEQPPRNSLGGAGAGRSAN